jgi:hypothetical protein
MLRLILIKSASGIEESVHDVELLQKKRGPALTSTKRGRSQGRTLCGLRIFFGSIMLLNWRMRSIATSDLDMCRHPTLNCPMPCSALRRWELSEKNVRIFRV